ncbi:hypothetical protein B0H11DRAFT_1901947 [Mycena galericulata]|nr:hypothetical protein B0H11DRAFT_1901947 [Mycena galericulata]
MSMDGRWLEDQQGSGRERRGSGREMAGKRRAGAAGVGREQQGSGRERGFRGSRQVFGKVGGCGGAAVRAARKRAGAAGKQAGAADGEAAGGGVGQRVGAAGGGAGASGQRAGVSDSGRECRDSERSGTSGQRMGATQERKQRTTDARKYAEHTWSRLRADSRQLDELREQRNRAERCEARGSGGDAARRKVNSRLSQYKMRFLVGGAGRDPAAGGTATRLMWRANDAAA